MPEFLTFLNILQHGISFFSPFFSNTLSYIPRVLPIRHQDFQIYLARNWFGIPDKLPVLFWNSQLLSHPTPPPLRPRDSIGLGGGWWTSNYKFWGALNLRPVHKGTHGHYLLQNALKYKGTKVKSEDTRCHGLCGLQLIQALVWPSVNSSPGECFSSGAADN